MRLLIIEDNKSLANSMKTGLEKVGSMLIFHILEMRVKNKHL